MDVVKEYMVSPDISFLDKVKIQAQVLVPLIKALRKELGEERANEFVYSTLRAWSRQLFLDLANQSADSPQGKWDSLTAALSPKFIEGVEMEEVRHDEEAWDFKITRCRYAEFFKSLNEPELGALLTCEVDVDMAEASAPAVEMNRPQTIMKGASYCDFRYKMKKGEA